jgi:hypothetical protein
MVYKNQPTGGRLAQPCQSTTLWEVASSSPVQATTFTQKLTANHGVPRGSPRLGHVAPNQPTTSCHVSNPYCHVTLPHQLSYCSVILPRQLLTSSMPRVKSVLPRHLATSTAVLLCHPATSAADVIRATCHPYSGDTCHYWICPVDCSYAQICLTRVASWSCHVSPSGFATSPVWTVRSVQSAFHVDCVVTEIINGDAVSPMTSILCMCRPALVTTGGGGYTTDCS